MLKYVLVGLCALCAYVNAQSSSVNCETDWRNQRQCMKDKRDQYSSNKEMNEQNRQNARYKINQCYKRAGCQSPFPPTEIDNQRKTCGTALRRSIRRDLKSCLSNKNYRDYDMPKENEQSIAWGQDAFSVKKNPCNRAKNDQNFKSCMIDAYNTTFNNNKGGSRKSDACAIRKSCNDQYQVHQQCYDRQQTIKSELCNCAGNLPFDKYKADYENCMSDVEEVDAENDFNYAAIGKIKDKYCRQKKDPCNGFNSRSSNYKGRGSGKNWGRSSSSSTQTSNTNYDFEQVGDTDSGVFPSVGNVMNSGDSAGDYDLNSGIASSNSGMSPDLFSAFSGGSSSQSSGGGGLFSSFLGGGSGGGGGFADILGGLGGGAGGLDPLALIGGVGKKKK